MGLALLTVFLSPSKVLSLHSLRTVADGGTSVPGAEPEFREDKAGQSPGNQVLQSRPGGKCSHG